MTYSYIDLEKSICLLLVVLVIYWFWYQWKFRKQLNVARKLPTVTTTWPLIGHVMQSKLRHLLDPRDALSYFLLEFSYHASQKNIKNYCLWFGPKPYIMITNPEDIKVVAMKHLEKGEEFDWIKFAAGNGILTGPVTIWKATRKVLQSMFHSRNIDYIISNTNAKSRILVKNMSTCVGNTDLNVLQSIIFSSTISFTLDFIYGSEIELLGRTAVEKNAKEVVTSWLDLWIQRCISIFSRMDVFFHIIYRKSIADIKKKTSFITDHANEGGDLKPVFEIHWTNRQTLRRILPLYKDGLLTQRLTEVLSRKVTNFKEEESLKSVLDMGRQITMSDAFAPFMAANKCVSCKDFESNVRTVLVAGAKTTSFTLSTCFLMLAIHQDIQDKVYEEIISCVGNTKEDIDKTCLNKLIYTDQVIKETMRLFPVIPSFTRRLTSDATLSFGVLPAGSQIKINVYGTHMDPKVYPDPLKFDPNRFSSENVLKRHKFSFLPFGAGPRNCIGKDLAYLAMKVFLVHILMEYRFTSTSQMKDIKLVYNIEMRVKNGCQVAITKRH